MLKCPYYGLWKVHILVLGVPNNRLTCTQSHKYFHCHNMHLFLHYLLKDSQPIRSTVHFPKLLLFVMLICGDWFHFIMPVMPEKAVFVSAVLLCVQQPLFLPLQKCHLAAKNYLHFYSDQWEKTNKWAGNMLMFHVDINMKRLGIRFKNNLFQWFRVDSFFWEKIALYMCTFRVNTLQNVFIHLELCYTLYER